MLTNMFLCGCVGWVVVYPLRFIRFKYKPLNCEFCLAGWLAAYYCWDRYNTPLWMAGAMVSAVLITKMANK